MYFVSLETTLWGLARFSNFLALMLHCAALEPGREDSSRPAHITLRNAAFQRAKSHYMLLTYEDFALGATLGNGHLVCPVWQFCSFI